MKKLIEYIRSCFCEHDWELILEYEDYFRRYKTYKCRKCGCEKQYKCG